MTGSGHPAAITLLTGNAPRGSRVQFGSVDAWPPDGSKFIMFSESESTPTCRGLVHLLLMSMPLLISHTQTETVSPTTKSRLTQSKSGWAGRPLPGVAVYLPAVPLSVTARRGRGSSP